MAGLFFLNGITQIEQEGKCKNIVKHMKTLFRIYALHTLTKQGSALGVSRYLAPEHFRMMSEQLMKEYLMIRPHMLNLIEAFELNDNLV
jgi:acyl-CoA oxidase